jgi:cytosine/adenosine deaminase-related metal-dependent hydrolase
VIEVETPGAKSRTEPVVDHGPGVIMPALVNAHTHLSLSGLSGQVDMSDGFLNWIRALIAARGKLEAERSTRAVANATESMKGSGIGMVGEFGPHIPVAEPMVEAGLSGIIWLEFFGNHKELPGLPEQTGEVAFAYAGHAPNTTSPRLLQHIKATDRQKGRRFCMHLAESEEEVEFLAKGKGAWADFLKGLGMNFSDWDCWGKRPVDLANELGLLDEETLAVHLLQVTREEITLLAQKRAKVCLCPRSNLNLHGRLPEVDAFVDAGLEPALGTDSLASNVSLSMFDEMRFLAEQYSSLTPDNILAMATLNGARALGRRDCGCIEPGQTARLIYVDISAKDSREASEKLVSENEGRAVWL